MKIFPIVLVCILSIFTVSSANADFFKEVGKAVKAVVKVITPTKKPQDDPRPDTPISTIPAPAPPKK